MGVLSKGLLTVFLCAVICAGAEEAAAEHENLSLLEVWKQRTENAASDAAEKIYNEAPQLTEKDILEMNGGDADFLYSEDGYLTFLRGKFYEMPVTDTETGIESLQGIAGLLGLSKGSEFFAVYGERDAKGYTYLTYRQRYGELTLENAVLKIILDPQGYTAGVVSSFTPNVGIAEQDEPSVTKEEAEQIVREEFPQYRLTLYTQYTRQTSVTIQGVAYHAWAVFSRAPASAGYPEGRGYLEHLAGYEGSYLTYLPVSSPEELVPGDNAQTENALAFFDGLAQDSYTAVVKLQDGTAERLTVPVARDAAGMHYLADTERHILLADYYSYAFEGKLVPWSSLDNTGWPEHYLLAYDRYCRVYDFYKSHGMESVDGFGCPILILTDYCDSLKKPENNAVYLGFSAGWAVFSASAVNDYGECVDVAAHEFTHGITDYTAGGNLYQNASGAVNEGLSDVCGNLCEMLLKATEDTKWLLAEKSGAPVRSMSEPGIYGQPVKIGGMYYYPDSEAPVIENDYGGVHINSSLISHTAYRLCEEGMEPEEVFLLWQGVQKMLTPRSGYQEVHMALKFAAKIQKLDLLWQEKIDEICGEAGY
ncbi:MAG: M4 family metallopeptidase [Eubacteriales bacterium]|nr:M4 family metallopeptidase [Eubacteriales bacterium]